MDLEYQNMTEDPYYRDNLLKFYKYESDDWKYLHSFYVDDNFTSRNYLEFVFEGLDTHANVVVNGRPIL